MLWAQFRVNGVAGTQVLQRSLCRHVSEYVLKPLSLLKWESLVSSSDGCHASKSVLTLPGESPVGLSTPRLKLHD